MSRQGDQVQFHKSFSVYNIPGTQYRAKWIHLLVSGGISRRPLDRLEGGSAETLVCNRPSSSSRIPDGCWRLTRHVELMAAGSRSCRSRFWLHISFKTQKATARRVRLCCSAGDSPWSTDNFIQGPRLRGIFPLSCLSVNVYFPIKILKKVEIHPTL